MSDQIKMFGPFASMNDAAKAGFKNVKGNPRRDSVEFAFWVVIKPIPGKMPTYCFTEPQTSDEHTLVRLEAPPGLRDNIHAFCHTHPTNSRTSGAFFGPDDKSQFQESRKFFPTPLAWYLLNPFDEILFANDEKQFLGGIKLKW
jgi:hypothetical protein